MSLAACRAHEEWGWRAEHERQRVCVVFRALLPTPALLHSPAVPSNNVDGPDHPHIELTVHYGLYVRIRRYGHCLLR